ncbi:MAG TPA: hypothetical protein VNO32_45845, partial [Candidatus Acidoferrum sp.]|nr:hypothetical protein [Candidatus Acidoferrum sp.]
RSWSSSSIIFLKWVTGTPPVTHTYIQTIKQPTLHYLTRSVRRRAATSKPNIRTIARGGPKWGRRKPKARLPARTACLNQTREMWSHR